MATAATICVRDVLKPDNLSNQWLPRRRAQSEATRLLNLRAQHAHTTSSPSRRWILCESEPLTTILNRSPCSALWHPPVCRRGQSTPRRHMTNQCWKPRRHTRAPLAQRARSHRYFRGCVPGPSTDCRDDTHVRLSHNVRAHTATLAAVRPVDRLLTRGQIQSRELAIWLISELMFLMHACTVRWRVACVWPALSPMP